MAKLYFRYAAMNAGKSTALLQVAHNYAEQGRAAVVFTAQVDDRYGVGKVTSRLGPSCEAHVFYEGFCFFDWALHHAQAHSIDCLLVDEAQFLSEAQVKALHRVVHVLNIPVICYGLRSDFKGTPFEGSTWLLTLADELEEMKTICSCGRKATMNIRVSATGERCLAGGQVEIGGNSRYKQVCGECFYK
jgi:thymidine kinase